MKKVQVDIEKLALDLIDFSEGSVSYASWRNWIKVRGHRQYADLYFEVTVKAINILRAK